MKKAKLYVEETFKYRREVVVSIPDNMTEKQLNEVLTLTERKSDSADDLLWELKKKHGIDHEPYSKDFDCPDSTEVECTEYDLVSD